MHRTLIQDSFTNGAGLTRLVSICGASALVVCYLYAVYDPQLAVAMAIALFGQYQLLSNKVAHATNQVVRPGQYVDLTLKDFTAGSALVTSRLHLILAIYRGGSDKVSAVLFETLVKIELLLFDCFF